MHEYHRRGGRTAPDVYVNVILFAKNFTSPQYEFPQPFQFENPPASSMHTAR
jgi:hypothetical protein